MTQRNRLVAVLSILCTISASSVVTAQEPDLPDPQPYFSAFIVSNIDSSIYWYAEILGFELINKLENEQRGFKQSNLKRGEMLVELIELKTASVPENRVQGIFKVGFMVEKFDNWIEYLKSKNVQFQGQVIEDPISGKRVCIVLDPDGNRIQIFEK